MGMAYTLTSRSVHRAVLVAALLIPTLAACGSDDPKTSVKIVSPAEGANIAGGVAVSMSAAGITIEPAGDVHKDAGHFHVIADAGCVAKGSGIPKDAQHVHFGKAQTEGTIYLTPGKHELCLQVGDGAHVALDVTDRVTVNVGVTDQEQWCKVATEVDGLLATGDGEDFAATQAAYANAQPLLAQLEDGLKVVDADSQSAADEVVQFAKLLVDAIVSAADEAAAEEALAPIWSGEEVPVSEAGIAWMLDTCGIDIDSDG